MKFGHIGIKVLDIERSLAFYNQVLSAKVLSDEQYPTSRLIFLEIGGTVVELISKSENESREPGPIEHIAFKVDSLDEKMDMLETLGIEYSKPRVVGTNQIIFFDGPNNEKFEFAALVDLKKA
jgi:lactoylglutathione lyase